MQKADSLWIKQITSSKSHLNENAGTGFMKHRDLCNISKSLILTD